MTLAPETEAAAGSAMPAATPEDYTLQPGQDAGDPRQKEEEVPKIGVVSSLDDIPEVARYLHRVMATAVSFKTAKVEEIDGGYPRRVGTITFSLDGAVKVNGPVEAPSEEEAEKIRAAFARCTFPKLVTLAAIGDGPPDCDLDDDNTFICHDFNEQVVMVHQRYHTQDGGKGFIPWTRWSDGKWRKMEPEVMPFYGLPGAKEHATLFLHEGAKAAARVRRIIEGRVPDARFPWLDEVRYGAHIGWIGGIHAVGRSDWASLAKMGWSRVVILADNDYNGKGVMAAEQIAPYFSCSTFIVTFDRRFADGHDCGDEWPDELFDDDGYYSGPTMDDCLRPAMQATEEGERQPGRSGALPIFLKRSFAEQVGYTITPPTFFFRDRPSHTYTEAQFNALTAPFSDAPKSTASKILAELSCQYMRLQYDCANKPGPLVTDNRTDWNVYQPTRVKPLNGSAEPWLEFLRHLFPNADERQQVMRWLATLIAKPQIRMRYGLLLISETQGVGKNTLAHVLAPLIGHDNISYPSEKAVTDSQFNDWQSRKRLVFLSEIYTGSSRAAYDQMKSVITDDVVSINEKNVPPYKIANWATVIACSNSMAALHLDSTDRRWFVPVVTDREQPAEYWGAFYHWLRGRGSGIVLRWAQDFVQGGNHVRTEERAPGTGRKDRIVEASRSEGQELAHSLAEHLRDRPEKSILRLKDVRQWIAVQRGFVRNGEPDLSAKNLEKPATITAIMKKVPGITVWADKRRPNFGAVKDAVVMNFETDDDVSWPAIKEYMTTVERIAEDPM